MLYNLSHRSTVIPEVRYPFTIFHVAFTYAWKVSCSLPGKYMLSHCSTVIPECLVPFQFALHMCYPLDDCPQPTKQSEVLVVLDICKTMTDDR